jgi:protein-disulfide isomerase
VTGRRALRAVVAASLLAGAPACDRSSPQPVKLGAAQSALVASAAVTPAAAARPLAMTSPPPMRRAAPPAQRTSALPDRSAGSSFILRLPTSEAPSPRGRDLAEASAEDPARGRPDAAVTAIIFGDVQCPYTSKAVAALEALQLRTGRDRLRLVWKSYPLGFHRRALPAAEAAAAVQLLAGPEAAFRVLDDALAGALDDQALQESARTAGAATESYRFIVADSRDAIRAKIDADRALADSLGVRSVPEVFIGDLVIHGAASEAEYARAVDDVLARGPAPTTDGAAQ